MNVFVFILNLSILLLLPSSFVYVVKKLNFFFLNSVIFIFFNIFPQELPPTDASNSALKKLIQKDALPVQMKEFLQLTPYQRIKYILKIIARKLHTNYCNFFPVPSMRCPIVRFSHKISEITCDFSIQNK